MNNLYRELAPISATAWAQIEDEASRTLKRHLAARRVVDLRGPATFELSAVGAGHVRRIEAPSEGIEAAQREAKALVELRAPFELTRQAIDDVERGAKDSDWSPLKDAARKIAFAEDRAVFDGYASAGIQGVRPGASNPPLTLPADVKAYPDAVAQAVGQLRLAGVNGPTRSCWAPSPIPRSAAPAIAAIRSCGISSVSSTARSSGPLPSPEALCSPPAAATSSCISARTFRSAI